MIEGHRIESPTWEAWHRIRKTKPAVKVHQPGTPMILGFGGRDYQIRAFENLRGKTNVILKAPTGSGKSLIMLYLAAAEVIDSKYKRRQVIAVPQLHIADGFHEELIQIDGKIIEMKIENLCRRQSESVLKLKEFLLEDFTYTKESRNNQISGSIVTVSHSALVLAFDQMSEKEIRKALKRVTIRIDEFHHVSSGENEEETNKLGDVVNKIEQYGGQLAFASATPFRGDNRKIISHEFRKQFTVEMVTLVEYLATTSIEAIISDFISYDDHVDIFNKIVAKIRSEKDQPCMIILPSEKQKFFKTEGDKERFARKLIAAMRKLYSNTEVLDFVTVEHQKNEVERFRKFKKDEKAFHVLITCGIGREGLDWKRCSRIHNLSFDRSISMFLQKFGRGTRDSEGKTDVAIYSYVPRITNWESEETRTQVSDCFNAAMGTAVMDDNLCPLMVRLSDRDRTRTNQDEVNIAEIFGEDIENIDDTILREFHKLSDEDKKDKDIIRNIIASAVAEFELDYEPEDMEEVIGEMLVRIIRIVNPRNQVVRLPGFNVKYIRHMGWDKVVSKYLAGRTIFGANINRKDLQKLRRILMTPPDVHYESWKKLCSRFGGYEKAEEFLSKNKDKEKYSALYTWLNNQRLEWLRENEEIAQ